MPIGGVVLAEQVSIIEYPVILKRKGRIGIRIPLHQYRIIKFGFVIVNNSFDSTIIRFFIVPVRSRDGG